MFLTLKNTNYKKQSMCVCAHTHTHIKKPKSLKGCTSKC